MWLRKKDTETLKKYGEKLGRDGIAERIIKLCGDVVKAKSYKKSVIISGQIRALAMACQYDDYWDEKMSKGFGEELTKAKIVINWKRPEGY